MDERLSLNNDFEFSTRILLEANQVLFTPGAKVYYRSGMVNSLANSYSKKAFKTALLSNELGINRLLQADDSSEMKLLCANRLKEWVFRMYPKHHELIRSTEKRIKELGGSKMPKDGGGIFKAMQKFLGWKLATLIQLCIYKMGYKPKNPHL